MANDKYLLWYSEEFLNCDHKYSKLTPEEIDIINNTIGKKTIGEVKPINKPSEFSLFQ